MLNKTQNNHEPICACPNPFGLSIPERSFPQQCFRKCNTYTKYVMYRTVKHTNIHSMHNVATMHISATHCVRPAITTMVQFFVCFVFLVCCYFYLLLLLLLLLFDTYINIHSRTRQVKLEFVSDGQCIHTHPHPHPHTNEIVMRAPPMDGLWFEGNFVISSAPVHTGA